MACAEKRIVTIRRAVYTLPNPTNMTEISKLMSLVQDDLKASRIEYWDDTVTMTADDTEITFSYDLPEGTVPA